MGLFSRTQTSTMLNGRRLPMMAGNWKMNKTMDEAIELTQTLSYEFEPKYDQCEIVLCPPFIDIRSAQVVLMSDRSPIKLAGQDVHPAESGAYTGCVSASMLKSVDCAYCIVGHSERREYFNETDADINAKIKALLAHDMKPILCCGESLECRDSGNTLGFVTGQIRAGLEGVAAEDVALSVIAYEPIWAIGTGRTATPEQAQEVCAAIRATLRDMYGDDTASKVRILYGGSMKPGNVDLFMPMEDIDGGLIGGAALDASSFIQLIRSAEIK